jgi:phospholipid transport system substrate-binding protein
MRMVGDISILPSRGCRRASLVALSAVLVVLAGVARADPGLATADPAAFLRAFSSEAINVLADSRLGDKERNVAFRRLFKTGFDVDVISRFVLGRYWRLATKPERLEYRGLFEDFIIANYSRRLNGYSGETLEVGAVRPLGETGAMVSSRIRRPQAPPIKVDWRLRRKAGAWRIIDMEVEGVSLAVTQRSEFSTVIANGGGRVESLLERLREKTGRAKAGGD